jgi:hypothetical protein
MLSRNLYSNAREGQQRLFEAIGDSLMLIGQKNIKELDYTRVNVISWTRWTSKQSTKSCKRIGPTGLMTTTINVYPYAKKS